MEKGILKFEDAEIKYVFLKDKNSKWVQCTYTIMPKKMEHIQDQIKTIEKAEAKLFLEFSIPPQAIATKRFFSSDLITHFDEIKKYKERQNTDFFMSVVEQPPSTSIKLSLMGMCMSNITSKFREDRFFYFDTTSGVRHIFGEHLIDVNANEYSDSEKQTHIIFTMLQQKLTKLKTSIEEGVIRTWLYTPHVDADYFGIVKARRELFESINLTKETHYIASTGIQGGSANQFARVFMDAYAVKGVSTEKIRYIQAPDYLGPTHEYGVTFERATAVIIGETDYLFISGTASINNKGDVLHPGDIVKQTERTLENISALVQSAGFANEDLTSAIIYLRDATDYPFVKEIMDKYCKNLPAIYVKASVCRPGWLIEIEATAAKNI